MNSMNRRRVLRGMMGGGATTVALPLLNCFLNGNGDALADGKPMPTRFGTWFWGLGIARGAFNPKQTGVNWEITQELQALKPVKSLFNVFTDYMVYRDSYAAACHYSGWVATRSGQFPAQRMDRPGETIDVTVANKIGRTTRFRMLNATATGDVRDTVTYEGQNAVVPAEFSPVNFYTRLFGPGYQDPNAKTFTPDPDTMLRKSVLSSVIDKAKVVTKGVGADDRQRLDQYFTGLRELEHQLAQQLTKPEPIPTCHTPSAPKQDPQVGVELGLLTTRHNMMADLMVLALSCDQTRVFSMVYTGAQAVTIKKGYEKTAHICTHEEPVDPVLGYQPTVDWFTSRAMESWAYFIQAFDKIKEGDRTLLDNTLILAHSDTGSARVHSLDGLPLFTAGKAGGKMKTGYHIDGKSAAPTEIGLTAMKVMGIDLPQWGTKSNTTSKILSEILV